MADQHRAFYDTVVFVLSLNDADSDGSYCRSLVDPRAVTWTVGFSEITRAEANINEYLDAIVVQFAQAGVPLTEIFEPQIKATIKGNRDAFTALRKLGVGSRDRRQIMAAASMSAEYLVTRDRDYLDPRHKRTKHGNPGRGAVENLVEQELACAILYPADAVARST